MSLQPRCIDTPARTTTFASACAMWQALRNESKVRVLRKSWSSAYLSSAATKTTMRDSDPPRARSFAVQKPRAQQLRFDFFPLYRIRLVHSTVPSASVSPKCCVFRALAIFAVLPFSLSSSLLLRPAVACGRTPSHLHATALEATLRGLRNVSGLQRKRAPRLRARSSHPQEPHADISSAQRECVHIRMDRLQCGIMQRSVVALVRNDSREPNA